MKTFLKAIAEQYIKNEPYCLKDYCFVFPNRRSGVFFKHYLIEMADKPILMPQITTISDLIAECVDKVEANRTELIIILYDEYRKLCEQREIEVPDFDKFVFWGDIILSDFNDVDRYLVDAKELFSNVKDIKDLQSNYLTDGQREVLKMFGFSAAEYNVSDFWITRSDVQKKFLSLWEVLYPLYESLRERLIKEGKSYQGQMYRLAVEQGLDKFKFSRYIFIGFTVLSASELKIFRMLQKRGIADFYWDTYSGYFDEWNKGGKFVRGYSGEFKSKYDLDMGEYSSENPPKPNVHIWSVPSNIGQTKYAAEIVRGVISKSETIAENLIDTAVVLPEESLFIPTLTAMQDIVDKVNITMGYPLKLSSIATFINLLSKLQGRVQKDNGKYTFFQEDVKNVLMHPYIKDIDPEGCVKILTYVNTQRKIRLTEEDFASFEKLSAIFSVVADLNERSDVYNYLMKVFEICHASNIAKNPLEKAFIDRYIVALEQIMLTLEQNKILLSGNTFFYLLDRMLASTTISFQGEPLEGLQIMGILEARNLDFKNVIILSMNERVFPKKIFTKSFVPNSLRKAYGMSTIEHQESIFTYYFYRLISRAKNVHLLYDSRTQGLGSGEPSRYIYQLRYLYNINEIGIKGIVDNALSYKIVVPSVVSLKVPKTPEIMNKLEEYATPGTKKYISASTVNKYISCPLSYYFKNVENINIEEDVDEFINSAEFGTIVHDVMSELYPVGVVDFSAIKDEDIKKRVEFNVNKTYLKLSENKCDRPLSGDAILIADIVAYYIKGIIEYDKKISSEGELEIVGCEKQYKGFWEDYGINFMQFIDRIDIIRDKRGKETLRIVDYKTGNDGLVYKDPASMFDMTNVSWNQIKAILQLFLYCNFYNYIEGCNDRAIQPVIYRVRDIAVGGKEFVIKHDNLPITDYHSENEEIMDGFKSKIKELFNPEVPFIQTENRHTCNYCPYKIICQR